MNILSFFRRTKSRYAEDKAVAGFERVVHQTGFLRADRRTAQLADLIEKENPTAAEVERIGKLLGDP